MANYKTETFGSHRQTNSGNRRPERRAQDERKQIEIELAFLKAKAAEIKIGERLGKYRNCPELLRAEKAGFFAGLELLKYRCCQVKNSRV